MKNNEELFEPIFRRLRFKESLKHIPNSINKLLDLGCGPRIPFYHFLKSNRVNIDKYYGFDPLLNEHEISQNPNSSNIVLVKKQVSDLEKFEDNSVDIVTGFAFLEHIENPSYVINQSIRILKPGVGKAIFTTPTKIAKPILEFLAFKLHLVSAREIAEHKMYFHRNDLESLVDISNIDKIRIDHAYFELGFNNIFVVQKLR